MTQHPGSTAISDHDITSIDALRQHYATPQERALRKQIDHLDGHCQHFIALSPFVLLATGDAAHQLDASPRGGDPGFVKTPDAHTLLLPDSPGNNRLDSLENIIATGQAGLLFLIPGVDETLRVNGRAVLSQRPDWIALCTNERRAPKLVVAVAVQAAYLHCAKAFMRSKLWNAAAQVPRSSLPSMGQMISDQTGIAGPPETQDAMARRYAPDL